MLDNTPPQPEVAGSGPARPSTPMQLPNILTELGSLGSLEAFLETRGFISDSPNSLSFSDIYGEDPSPTAAATPSTAFPDTIHELTLMSPPTVPQDNGQPTKELVLYLSSDLLKSHLPLVQSLETMPDPPQLVFRDYNAQEGVDDADIIIPPATGIILTTAQALTQRHLPGNRRHLDSPVLERIDRLAPRYEDFYVLASSGQTAAKRTVDAIDFLKSFCESISRTVTVTPLVVSSEKVVEWVLALAFEKGGTQ